MRSNASTCLPNQIKLPLRAPSLETAYAVAVAAGPAGERVPDALPAPAQSRALVAHPYRDAAVSSITLLPRAIQLGESRVTSGPGWTLTLQGARGSASLRLTSLDLELGV